LRAKRSNLLQCNYLNLRDYFVAPLLAMTGEKTFYEFINITMIKTGLRPKHQGLQNSLVCRELHHMWKKESVSLDHFFK
jgi:hypothetical protein